MLAPDTSATRALAEFAAALSYNDLPEPVVGRSGRRNVMVGRSTSSVALPVDAVGIRESQLQMTATAVASAESRAT